MITRITHIASCWVNTNSAIKTGCKKTIKQQDLAKFTIQNRVQELIVKKKGKKCIYKWKKKPGIVSYKGKEQFIKQTISLSNGQCLFGFLE